MNPKLLASLLTFVKFMIYTTLVNVTAAGLPAQGNPLFWKLLGASFVAAVIKAALTFGTTQINPIAGVKQ